MQQYSRGLTTQDKTISIYQDTTATDNDVAKQMARLTACFPTMDNLFISVLSERIVSNGFSKNRLIDAVNHVLDNFKYKKLSVADIITFDKKAKLYTHNEAFMYIESNGCKFTDFVKVEVNSRKYWVLKREAEEIGMLSALLEKESNT